MCQPEARKAVILICPIEPLDSNTTEPLNFIGIAGKEGSVSWGKEKKKHQKAISKCLKTHLCCTWCVQTLCQGRK